MTQWVVTTATQNHVSEDEKLIFFGFCKKGGVLDTHSAGNADQQHTFVELWFYIFFPSPFHRNLSLIQIKKTQNKLKDEFDLWLCYFILFIYLFLNIV